MIYQLETELEIDQLILLFKDLDINHDGAIDKQELKYAFELADIKIY